MQTQNEGKYWLKMEQAPVPDPTVTFRGEVAAAAAIKRANTQTIRRMCWDRAAIKCVCMAPTAANPGPEH